jgi:TRAP-type C4-dicarboxylate transport system permease small subunit
VTRVYAQVCRLEALVAGVFLVVMVVMIFVGGIARMMAMPLNWTTDVATCLFAWACFLCADVTWRNNGLMSVELVSGRLAPQVQRLLTWCNYLIICAFLLYVMGAGMWLSWVSRARSFQGIPGVSYSWITMSLPVGAALLLITTVLKLRDLQRDGAPA